MSPHARISKQKRIIATLLLLMSLACGPLNRLQEFNRQDQTQPTAITPIGQDDTLDITEAYTRLQTLPGYRLESQHVVRDNTSNRTQQTMTGEYDRQGNAHILIEYSDGQQRELYIVGGETYEFEPEYQGWVHSAQVQPNIEVLATRLRPVQELIQLTTQAGTQPVVLKHETLQNRAVTRYAIADTVQSPGNTTINSPIDLRGTLWVDDETGAVLKSETFLYENTDSLPTQEFILEVSTIGSVGSITTPAPIVDPVAIARDTATAQVQLVLPAKLNYQGEQISFEIVPEYATQTPDSSPRRTEVQLVLRQLPGSWLQEADIEPFLVQLRQQLTLSIPERNLIVTSSGYRLIDHNIKDHTLSVTYYFNADLEDFSHIELILSGQGNPLFVPVPVEE